MNSINSRAGSDKRRVEGSLHTMQAEIDDLLHQAKNSEEKAKKAMVDAARLADELRSEQDHTTTLTQGKRALETQLGELENRLADANDAAMRGGNSAMAKPVLERTPRLTRELSARSRSSSSRTTRTKRT